MGAKIMQNASLRFKCLRFKVVFNSLKTLKPRIPAMGMPYLASAKIIYRNLKHLNFKT